MTLVEDHPVLRLPSREEYLADEKGVTTRLEERALQISLERTDPLRYGFRPAIWDVVDDLLIDGHTVVLDVSRLKEIGSEREIDVPVEMEGAPIVWIAGCQRSSKTEYAGRKCVEVFCSPEKTRGWSFADNATKSKAQQQPVLFKYLPIEIRNLLAKSGKYRHGSETNIGYNLKTGFTDDSFMIAGSGHWFKNYEQDVAIVEGDQLDIVWFDELRNLELFKTIRFRMGDRGGIIIATFTSINEKYAAIDREFNFGSTTKVEIPAKFLPLKDEQGKETGRFESVPRVKAAGPGSDGDLRANIVYFHITDNPYYGWDARKKGDKSYGVERFAKLIAGAPRAKILARAYGILTTGASQQFPKIRDSVHSFKPESLPRKGTNYLILDPCSGRNWAMIWIRVTFDDRWWVYREWPSHDHHKAYIQGVGDPGAWALPSSTKFDGERGPAQTPFGFGLKRYIEEIQTREGDEEIFERWMDSRYGASPTTQYEGSTTLLEQMDQLGMTFLAASGRSIREGIDLINDRLFYDEEVKLGEFSKTLARINAPKLMVSEECPNTMFALKEWTGKDGNEGACKDFIDLLRYACLTELHYIGEASYAWRKY